jgi:hypothetical protein
MSNATRSQGFHRARPAPELAGTGALAGAKSGGNRIAWEYSSMALWPSCFRLKRGAAIVAPNLIAWFELDGTIKVRDCSIEFVEHEER